MPSESRRKQIKVGKPEALRAATWECRAVTISVVDVCALKPPCVDEMALEGPRIRVMRAKRTASHTLQKQEMSVTAL